MSEKTLGQVAYEAWKSTKAANPDLPSWEDAAQADVDGWEVVGAAVRDTVNADRDPRSRP